MAIAAFDVCILDFCKAICNCSPYLSGSSNTLEFESASSILWVKNFSKTHLFDLSVDNWANLISVGVNSTPTISSPWTADFPNLFLKNLLKNPSFFFVSWACGTGVPSSPFGFFLKRLAILIN